MSKIYLDYNATTSLDPQVLAAMEPFLVEHYGNPSSTHWAGRRALDAIAHARGQVARAFGALPSEVMFTSGGTEALNAAVLGVVSNSEFELPHIVVSAVEHPSVLTPCRDLEARGLARLSTVPVDELGRIDAADVAQCVRPDTVLVAVMLANNELGNVYDTAAIAEQSRAQNPNALILVDAVQAAGKIPVSWETTGADLLALSGHKFYGPKGVGALIQRRTTTSIRPLIMGGPQEGTRRAGTENVPGIVGLGVACALDHPVERIRALGDRLISGLSATIGGLVRHGDPEACVAGTYNFRIEGVDAEALLIELDLQGIAASSGSACASGTHGPSHVLLATGLSAAEVHQSIRLSLGRTTDSDEIKAVLDIIPAVVAQLRS